MTKLLLIAGMPIGLTSAIVGVVLWAHGGQTALAADPDGVIVGIDMDPTGNTATSLATIDRCREVSAGDVIDIDVWVDDLENDSILTSGYDLGGWPASGTDGTAPQITARNHLLFLNATVGSFIQDMSEALPDGDDPHTVNMADFGAAETNPPYTQGVIGRYTLDTTGAVAAVYELTLTSVVLTRDVPPGGSLTIQVIWDSTYCDAEGCYGLLAVDAPCPGPIEVDEFPNSKAQVTMYVPTLGTDTVTLTGPTTVEVDLGSLGDGDGDGREEVHTEIVQMELTGDSSLLGPITLRLRDSADHPFQGTIGEIEEAVNNTLGALDLPPFTDTGTADSFFDVFFEVEVVGLGLVLHNHDPKHMAATITHKPPAEEERYEDPTVIPLFDEAENPTGVEVSATYHTPNPHLPKPVGGTAEYPDVDQSPLTTADSPGGSSPVPYGAIGGAAAVTTALAIVAGGWYARRRRMR
jgi:hypothetical protein